MDGDDANKIHQYIEFVVTGNRQIYNVAFDVRGKITTDIQEINHFKHTLETMRGELEKLFNNILFLQVSEVIVPEIVTVWNNLVPEFNCNEPWVPENWLYLKETLKKLLTSPTEVDLLRFRQLNMETIAANNDVQIRRRIVEFLAELDNNNESFINEYCKGDQKTKDRMLQLIANKRFFIKDIEEAKLEDWENSYLQGLYSYIFEYKTKDEGNLEKYYQFIKLSTDEQKNNLVKIPLDGMYSKEWMEEPWNDFSRVDVDTLRERITTFNNLIVRLPVNSEPNCLASKHIFQDWKTFVDGAANYLKDNGQLTFESKVGLGSDLKEYEFNEYLVDGVPLVDYSWLYDNDPMNPKTDEDGNPIGDRWDYWTEEDFKWPQ